MFAAAFDHTAPMSELIAFAGPTSTKAHKESKSSLRDLPWDFPRKDIVIVEQVKQAAGSRSVLGKARLVSNFQGPRHAVQKFRTKSVVETRLAGQGRKSMHCTNQLPALRCPAFCKSYAVQSALLCVG